MNADPLMPSFDKGTIVGLIDSRQMDAMLGQNAGDFSRGRSR
jgi:hypothetical protein